MNIWQIGFVVPVGVSAIVVAFLLGYAAHYQWGLSVPRSELTPCWLPPGHASVSRSLRYEVEEAEEVTTSYSALPI
jgi:hypothetical protein